MKRAGDASKEVEQYIRAIDHLYADIRQWIEGTSITPRETTIVISEEQKGEYRAPALQLMDEEDHLIVRIHPVGTNIIGASGRVDFIGGIGKENIVLLRGNEPSMSVTIGRNGSKETRFSPIYRGVTEEGWYWIEDKIRAKANFLDQAVFWEVVAQVSDYEYSL